MDRISRMLNDISRFGPPTFSVSQWIVAFELEFVDSAEHNAVQPVLRCVERVQTTYRRNSRLLL